MEYWLSDQSRFDHLYGCANFNISEVPMEQRQWPVLGTLTIALFVIFESAYIPCALVIRRHLDNSCYQIMFMLALIDIPCLFIICLLGGLLSLIGAVYCSAPTLIYFAGMTSLFLWSMESCSVCLLALNRCLHLASPSLGNFLFSANFTWIYFIPVSAYSVYYGFFTKPLFWNSVEFIWSYDPYAGYRQGGGVEYFNIVDEIHSGAIAFIIPFIYTLFFLLIKLKKGHIFNQSSSAHYVAMFTQTFLICASNCINGLSYSILYMVKLGPALTILGCTFTWMLAHGLPPIVYLAANRTVRNECILMFRNCFNSLGRAFTRNKVKQMPSRMLGK